MSQVTLLISLAVGIIIPGLTTLVTNDEASDRLKALFTAFLAAVGGALSAYTSGPAPTSAGWEHVLIAIAVAWITAGVAYLTGWKPTGAAPTLAKKTARFGFGSTPGAHAIHHEETPPT